MWLALLTLSIVATLPLNVECCRLLPWRRRGKDCINLRIIWTVMSFPSSELSVGQLEFMGFLLCNLWRRNPRAFQSCGPKATKWWQEMRRKIDRCTKLWYSELWASRWQNYSISKSGRVNINSFIFLFLIFNVDPGWSIILSVLSG